MILTCKDRLIHYYEKFGYRNLGLSASVHGGLSGMICSWNFRERSRFAFEVQESAAVGKDGVLR